MASQAATNPATIEPTNEPNGQANSHGGPNSPPTIMFRLTQGLFGTVILGALAFVPLYGIGGVLVKGHQNIFTPTRFGVVATEMAGCNRIFPWKCNSDLQFPIRHDPTRAIPISPGPGGSAVTSGRTGRPGPANSEDALAVFLLCRLGLSGVWRGRVARARYRRTGTGTGITTRYRHRCRYSRTSTYRKKPFWRKLI